MQKNKKSSKFKLFYTSNHFLAGNEGVVQTFKQQDETKIKQRIKEGRALFEGADEEQLHFF